MRYMAFTCTHSLFLSALTQVRLKESYSDSGWSSVGFMPIAPARGYGTSRWGADSDLVNRFYFNPKICNWRLLAT